MQFIPFVVVLAPFIMGGSTAITGKKNRFKRLVPFEGILDIGEDAGMLMHHLFTGDTEELAGDALRVITSMLPPARYLRKAYKNYIED